MRGAKIFEKRKLHFAWEDSLLYGKVEKYLWEKGDIAVFLTMLII